MVDAVEELLEVHVHHDALTSLDVPLRLAHCIVRVAPGPEAVAVLREGGVPHRLQHLQDALLEKPVEHRRNPKLSDSTAALRNLRLPHQLRLVGALEQLLSNLLPVFREVLRQLVDGHPVHAGAALVLLHSLQRPHDVASLDHRFHQVAAS